MSKEIRPENDVNQLNNSQVILLTILAAIISAVASAAAVVQLYGDTPGDLVVNTIETVTETIVKEREVTVPGTTTVQQVVIKEGDLVAKAISQNSQSTAPIYVADAVSESEVFAGSGFLVAGRQVITAGLESDTEQISVNGISLRKRGTQTLSLWQSERDLNIGNTVVFSTNPVQVGQTIIYLSATNVVNRGIIESVNSEGFSYSEDLNGKGIGLMLDISGRVIGLWDGTQILSSKTVKGIIAELSSLPFGGIANATTTSSDDKGTACALFGGVYADEFDECLGVEAGQCLALGGAHNECASPCRNDPDAEVCIQSCEVVCSL